MLKPHSNPYGHKRLLAYRKAIVLQKECRKLTAQFPKTKTMIDLADQMDRSARSGKQNIVEGWKRNSTKEYDDFLGFSIGAIAELEEDCDDIWKGVYPELMGIKGIMGAKGAPSTHSSLQPHSTPSTPSSHSTHSAPSSPTTHSSHSTHSAPSSHSSHLDIEKLKFFPLDRSLPRVVQLKLRCKELNYLLAKLQKSLENKMADEGTMNSRDKMRMQDNEKKREDSNYLELLKQQGMARAKDGRIIEK